MQTFTIISVIVNLGFIALVFSLYYRRIISRYKRNKKLREIQENQRIKRIVDDYLNSLRKDD